MVGAGLGWMIIGLLSIDLGCLVQVDEDGAKDEAIAALATQLQGAEEEVAALTNQAQNLSLIIERQACGGWLSPETFM